ncbi:MAG: nucleoside hydrolase [Bacillaceae bacterium]
MKMILDLDTGIDDALALAYALGSPEVDLIGVVGSFGNVLLEESIDNTLSLLDMLGHNNIPVYAGKSCAMMKEDYKVREICRWIHGKNGVGNVELNKSSRVKEQFDGVDFMIESARKYGKELTIVATGPLTNLAAALEKEPAFKEMVGNVVIMGGALTVPGNTTPFAEANIHEDPEAANLVFTSGLKFTMVGLDVTMRTTLTKEETQKWREGNTVSGNIYADMTDHYIDVYKVLNKQLNGCALHDPLAVAVAIDPDLVQTLSMYMIVNTEGSERGRTTGDTARLSDPNPNVKACVGVNGETFKKRFMERLTNVLVKG